MNSSSANRKYQATHPWDSKAPRETSDNQASSSQATKDPVAAQQSATLGNHKTQTSDASMHEAKKTSDQSSSLSDPDSNYTIYHGYKQYNPRHEYGTYGQHQGEDQAENATHFKHVTELAPPFDLP
ncbi:hypothetical protein CPB97_004724 [Podila verticillata]|nr:hypothetical protein CPB97_004724 [Podila verticillata]